MGRPPRIHRDQILATACNVFTLKGYEATTLADIAGDLGVTAAAILRHFQSKQALFNDAMRRTVVLPQCIFDLQTADPANPRAVLRRFAEEWLPFASTTIAQNIAVELHDRARPTIVLPFTPGADDSPPRKAFPIVAGYFRRAHEAGAIRIDDPRAAALLFMGTLFGYVFIHHVLRALPQPYPQPDFLDALFSLWTDGAFGGSRGRKKRPSPETTAADSDSGRGRRPASAVHAPGPKAERAGSLRDAGGADGQRRVARRRARGSRSRR